MFRRQRQPEDRDRLHKVRDRTTAAVAAGTMILGASATGCDFFRQPGVQGKNVFIMGDSLTNRMINNGGDLLGQLKQAGFNVVFAHGYEGKPLSFAQTLMADPKIQAEMKASDFIVNGFVSNPLTVHLDPGQLYKQIVAINAQEQSINPHARRYMYDLATSAPGLTGEFSMRNQMIFKAAANSQHGFDVARRYEAFYHGDAQNESPALHYAPIDADTVAHVHDQTAAGWRMEASVVVAALEYGLNQTWTYVNPKYQGNGLGGAALGALQLMTTPAGARDPSQFATYVPAA